MDSLVWSGRSVSRGEERRGRSCKSDERVLVLRKFSERFCLERGPEPYVGRVTLITFVGTTQGLAVGWALSDRGQVINLLRIRKQPVLVDEHYGVSPLASGSSSGVTVELLAFRRQQIAGTGKS
jgi:hypothetical protein